MAGLISTRPTPSSFCLPLMFSATRINSECSGNSQEGLGSVRSVGNENSQESKEGVKKIMSFYPHFVEKRFTPLPLIYIGGFYDNIIKF